MFLTGPELVMLGRDPPGTFLTMLLGNTGPVVAVLLATRWRLQCVAGLRVKNSPAAKAFQYNGGRPLLVLALHLQHWLDGCRTVGLRPCRRVSQAFVR